MSVRVLCQFSSCLLVDCFFVHIFFSILKLMPVVYRLHADDDSKRIFLLKEGWIFLTYGLQTDRSPCWRKAAVFFLFCNTPGWAPALPCLPATVLAAHWRPRGTHMCPSHPLTFIPGKQIDFWYLGLKTEMICPTLKQQF